MKVALEQYNGPLDVLLSLIQEKEMHISEISLGEVTEQFLSYIDTIEKVHPEELADFLVIASKLLLMKSRALLPQLMPQEEMETDLADQLRMYKMYVDVSKKINERWENAQISYTRTEPVRVPENPEPPDNVTTDGLQACMKRLLHKLTPPKPLPKTHIDKTVSLKEKIKQFRDFLSSRKQFSYHEALGTEHNKTEAIVGFLAILELVKQRSATLRQSALFGDITIERV